MKLAPKVRPYTVLSETLKPLHPFCSTCGWRKGGIDSWDGRRCKCGHSELPMVGDADFEERTGFFVCAGSCPTCHESWVCCDTTTMGKLMTKQFTCRHSHSWTKTFVGHLEDEHWV